ncbi:hypothetical protein CC78DRAFT_462835 [Lojkania enalia]|uniref:SRP9 domain-containing protein n=1 Tax=Lojkania enalia TaxID=147567 RepID=A0A9P4N0B9_9PLEO|nr:hypothetical protein CC78DRAFT_462835 [Didymosphaeria enalia]
MPYFATSTEWFEQSSLLLKARPTTTRITSKYTVLRPSASKIRKRKKYLEKRPNLSSTNNPSSTLANPSEPTATFKLKTYDPVSGTCLKYETNKAAEVGRLIGSLGKLSRHMAALPDVVDDFSKPTEMEGIETPTREKDVKVEVGVVEQKVSTGGGGGKKKKKAKK